MQRNTILILAALTAISSITSCKRNIPMQSELPAENAEVAFSDASHPEQSAALSEANIAPHQGKDNILNLDETVFIFTHTGSSSQVDTIFVISRSGVLLKTTPTFWNNTERFESMYLVKDVPVDLLADGGEFFRQDSEVTPPFLPEQVFTSRVDISHSKTSAAVFFRKDNDPLNAWLEELRLYVTGNGRQIEQIPEWIESDPRILRQITK